jgi:two-component system nitrogen regulation response regulator GlnG
MNPTPKVLIVEDERALALALAAAARHAGASSELAPTATQAAKKLAAGGGFDAMILDIGLPDRNGLDFLRGLPEESRIPTLVVTAHGEIGNLIEARQLGVREFFPKPLDFEAFTRALADVLVSLRQPPKAAAESAFIGAAPSMRPVFRQIAQACASAEPVLIRGETGSGKTRVAQLIRQHSPSGAAIVENAESLDVSAQADLLARIEAADSTFPRLLVTCGPALREAVQSGDFRGDLYYRLQVLEVRLPPLRERIEDLPVLTDYFAGQLAPDRAVEATDAALKRLARHDWPGNVRELRNVVSYAITAGAGATRIDESHLPAYLDGKSPAPTANGLPDELRKELGRWVGLQLGSGSPPEYHDLADALETGLLRELLRRYDGKLARLASELKANRATLRRKLRDG